MSRSILQSGKACYLTGSREGLHKHHIYGGGRRKSSEAWGCWVWLRGDWHNLASYGVHFNHELDMRLKKECQRAFEAQHGHETFMQVFGRNYLDAEEELARDTQQPRPGAEEDFEDTGEEFAPWESECAGGTWSA